VRVEGLPDPTPAQLESQPSLRSAATNIDAPDSVRAGLLAIPPADTPPGEP